MDDNSSYAESLEWHDSLHDKSAPYFPWQSSDRQDLFVPEFDEEEITNITRSLVTPVPSKASADDLLVYPSYLRRSHRQLGPTDRCESAQIFNQLKNEDADDSSDLMAVELDFEQHAFLREMDSPTNSFRTPSPRRTLQNNETTRNPQSRLALASKRYSIADTYETAAARDVTTSQRSLFDRQQLKTKRDFALPNSEVNDQTTNKLHRAYTVSNPKYSDQRLHKRSNSNLLPRTVYKSRTDEKLQLENSRPDAHPQVLNSLDSARHEEKAPEALFKINSRGVARPTQFKEPSTHSRSSSVQVNPNSYNPDMEPYAPRYSTSRIRESFHVSTAKTTEPVKKPQVTFNLEKGLYERNQEESDSPSTQSKQPSIARRWSTIEHSYDIKSDKALPQYRRSILGDKPRASSIIRPTALQSPTSAEFSNHQDLPSPRYRSRAAELASNADKNYEETYEELSKRLRSASIGSGMSQFSQKKQVQPTQSKSAEVLAHRSKSISAATPRTSGRDRTVSLPDDTPVEEKRDKSAQKSYLQSIKSGSSSLRLPQRSKMSRSLLPDFIGSSMLDITKEEEPMQRSADWSLRWPDEMLRRAKEEELQMSNHDHDAVLRHSYSRVSPSTTASSSSASNVSGDFSSRTATSKTRSTSTSIESLGRFSTIPESKFGVENGPSNRQSGAKYDNDDQSRRNQHAPSPTFSMYSEKPWITDRTGHYADEMYNQLGSMELAESEYLESNYPQARQRRYGMEEYGQSANQMVMQKRSNRYSSPASMVRTPNYKTQFARDEYEKGSSGSHAINRRPSQLAQGSEAITAPAKELLAIIRQRREKTLHMMSETGDSSRILPSRTKLPTANWN